MKRYFLIVLLIFCSIRVSAQDELSDVLRAEIRRIESDLKRLQNQLQQLEYETFGEDIFNDPEVQISRPAIEAHEYLGDDEDEWVAVNTNTVPGYLGAKSTDGVLRADTNGLDYTDGDDYITLAHADTSDQYPVDNTTNVFIQDVKLDEFGHVTNLESVVAEDEKVAVDNAATPGYLGALRSDGVLRADTNGLDYTDGGDFVTLAHKDTSDMYDTANSGDTFIQNVTVDTYGHLTEVTTSSVSNAIPNGTNNFDMLYWYSSAWNILPAGTPPAVLALNTNNLLWVTIDTKYKVIQRSTSGTVIGDWVRAH